MAVVEDKGEEGAEVDKFEEKVEVVEVLVDEVIHDLEMTRA